MVETCVPDPRGTPACTRAALGYTRPMLALVLSTVFSAGFGLLIRVAQGMGANLVAVGAANYLTAMVVNAALFLLGGRPAPSGTTVAIAVGGGFSLRRRPSSWCTGSPGNAAPPSPAR